MTRPLILLSNDDGYRAEGIQAIREALSAFGDVIVCAPEVEQSGASHALSLHRPVRLFTHDEGVYSVDGTPADCVYVALHADQLVLPRRPDIVVSGINHGVNLGDDAFYSGTVAAAREAALKGIPAIAFSAGPEANIDAAARQSCKLIETLWATQLAPPLLLNVNFPAGARWELATTRLGRRVYRDEVDVCYNPRGRQYLWLGGPSAKHHPAPGSDTEAYDAGIVGVTPLILDLWGQSDQSRVQTAVKDVPTLP